MKIKYWGHSCFQLTDEKGRAVVTDPYTGVGYELPEGIRADIVTVSHGHFDHNNVAKVRSDCVLFKSGEYDIDGIKIIGLDSWHDPKMGKLRGANVIYKMILDGIVVCHLGDLGEAFSWELVEKIGKVDVLLLPVGGTYTVDAAEAKVYADAIAPSTIIPMHYRPSDGALDILTVEPFLRQYAKKEVAIVPDGEKEISLDALADLTKVIYMERKKGE